MTSFYVISAIAPGLRRGAPASARRRACFSWILSPLHAMLMQHVVVLDQKVRNDPLSERTTRTRPNTSTC